jgi:tetratricopeptide (TPR) repeat protein
VVIGVNDQLQGVVRRFRGLASRRPGLATGLWGEPGIGKTHVATELLKQTPCPFLTVHATQTIPSVVRGLPRPKKVSVWLERSLERLGRDEISAPEQRVETLVGWLTATAPVILHVEDLHESAPEQLGFWRLLGVSITRIRGLGLIATSRNQPPAGFEAIRLLPLSREASDALLEQEAGANLPGQTLSWIFARAAGNPLFTLEFFRFLARQGFAWSDGQRWRWREPEREVLPGSVEALIEHRLGEATERPEQKQALNAKAVLGTEVNEKQWAVVADLSVETLHEIKTALERTGVLVGDEFAHPLYREVLARALSSDECRVLVRRALAQAEAAPGLVARLVTEAKLEPLEFLSVIERAIAQSKKAGNEVQAALLMAQALNAIDGERRATLALEAARILRRVDLRSASRLAEVATSWPSTAREATLLGAELLAVQGQLAIAEQMIERLPNTDTQQDRRARRLVLRVQARDFGGSLELWDQHAELRQSHDPTVLRCAIHALLDHRRLKEAQTVLACVQAQPGVSVAEGIKLENTEHIVLLHAGEFEQALALLDERIPRYAAGDDLRVMASALTHKANALERLGRLREAAGFYEKSSEVHARIGDLRSFASSRVGVAWNLWHLAEYQDAESLLLESREVLRDSSLSDMLAECEGILALLYLDWSPPMAVTLAAKHAQAALEIARRVNNPYETVSSLHDNAVVRVRQGRPNEGLVIADEMATLSEAHGFSGLAVNAMYCRALALEGLGQKDEALRLMRQAEAVNGDKDGMFTRKIGIEVARLAGDLELAREHLKWFEERGITNGQVILHRHFPELGVNVAGRSEAPLEPQPLQLDVLGPIRFRRGDAVIPLRGAKRKELLALLLEARLAGRTDVSRLALIEALYPDLNEVRASTLLGDLVYQVREVCGANVILTTTNGYALGAVSSDAEAFLQQGDTRLWRGPFLEGLHLVGVMDAVSETLGLALRAHTEGLITTDPDEAVRLGRLLLEMDPYDLEALRLTLRALRATGNHKSLNRAYAQARARLLEIGESLPERWAVFLGDGLPAPTGATG